MEALNEWTSKNPKQATIVAVGIFLLAGIIIYFTQFAGSGGGAPPATVPQTSASGAASGAASGGTRIAQNPAPGAAGAGNPIGGPGGAPAGGTAPGGAAGAGASSSDPDALQRTPPGANAGRANPMQPYWFQTPAPPIPKRTNTLGGTGLREGETRNDFTPPTPGTMVMASNFWGTWHATDAAPPIVTPSIPGGVGADTGVEESPDDRVAGVMTSGDKIMAIVERGSGDANTPGSSYIVQPGETIGADTVVAITPDTVTIRHPDGTLAQIGSRSGSLKGLTPATAQTQTGYGVGMPGPGPGMGGPYSGGPLTGPYARPMGAATYGGPPV